MLFQAGSFGIWDWSRLLLLYFNATSLIILILLKLIILTILILRLSYMYHRFVYGREAHSDGPQGGKSERSGNV